MIYNIDYIICSFKNYVLDKMILHLNSEIVNTKIFAGLKMIGQSSSMIWISR